MEYLSGRIAQEYRLAVIVDAYLPATQEAGPADSGALTYADIGIYWHRGPLFHDVGCLQRDCRGAPSRDSGRADDRREGGRDDRERPLDVSAPGFKTPTGA